MPGGQRKHAVVPLAGCQSGCDFLSAERVTILRRFLIPLLAATAACAQPTTAPADPEVSPETLAAVRACAAEFVSRYALPSQDGTHICRPKNAPPSMRVQIDGLRIGDVVPRTGSARSDSGADSGFFVEVTADRHRTSHQKLRRWNPWRPGPYPRFPSALTVQQRNGTWKADPDAMSRMTALAPTGDPRAIPQDDTPALPPGSELKPAAASSDPGTTDDTASSGSANLYLSLGIIAALLAIAVVIARRFADRGEIGPRFASATAGQAAGIDHLRRRKYLLNPAEHQFREALEAAVRPRQFVTAKVRLAELFDCPPGPEHRATAARLASCCADFVLTDPASSRIVAVVMLHEPDDADPEANRRREFIATLCARHQVPFFNLPVAADYSASLDQLRSSV